MTATTTPLGPEFPKEVINMLFAAIAEGNKQAARMLWSILQSFLVGHWLASILFLFVLFVAATFKAMMGRWGSLGSLLYNFFYFGILYVVGLIWGPEIFVSDLFHFACTAILYPVCYYVVGYILDETGVRKKFR